MHRLVQRPAGGRFPRLLPAASSSSQEQGSYATARTAYASTRASLRLRWVS